MKALGGSFFNFSVSRQREITGLDFSLCRHDFGFLVHQKRVGDGLVSLRTNCVAPISTAASAQTGHESEEIQSVNSDQLKTVRVRFKLHKQCMFGQYFGVVGNDPRLGLWDPSDGVPLNWSEGHVWTAEVDLPSHKVISYKFILKEITGTVSWQPGPDRVLETWETANTISVTEDWENPEFQIIDEVEVEDDLNELCLNGSGPLIAENMNQIVGEDVMEEQDDGNELNGDCSDEPSTLMVAENIDVEEMGLMNVAYNGESNPSSLKNEMGLVIDEEDLVLKQGLATMPTEETEEEEKDMEVSSIVGSTRTADYEETAEVATSVFDEIEVSTDPNQENNSIVEETTTESDESTESATSAFDEVEVSNDPNQENNSIVFVQEEATTESDENDAETKPEIHSSASGHYAETSEVMAAEEKGRFNEREKMESNILGGNIKWGRRTLHKILANLGFMQHG